MDSTADSSVPLASHVLDGDFVETHDPAPVAARRPAPAPTGDRKRVLADLRANMVPALVAAALFVALYSRPMRLLGWDWWNNPEAGHGLLLAPLAVWLVWRSGVKPGARPDVRLGLLIIFGAVVIRYMSGLAAEQYTMKMSMVMALAGFTVFAYGFRQLVAWWLPFTVLWLSVPLPELVTSTLALPLQFKASEMGASLLAWRDIPVLLNGNVILLPGGHQLFVAEACSGLRSLTALLSLGVLLGGMTLGSAPGRLLLVLAAIPIAILINGIRVFLTGFLVFFVSPELGEGFMHTTEGWLMFLIAFLMLGAVAWVVGHIEGLFTRWRTADA
ncbi:MAG: exosortase/archaeosortase family protein [Gemmatimonadaceae bacterium]